MKRFSNIPHPLLRDGQSQLERDHHALHVDYVKIEEKSLEDLIYFFQQYSQQVIFYNEVGKKSDWTPFFQNSNPFLLAQISKFNVTLLKSKYEHYASEFSAFPNRILLHLLLDKITALPFLLNDWFTNLSKNRSELGIEVGNLIESDLRYHVLRLIGLSNAAHSYSYKSKFNFSLLLSSGPWKLSKLDLVKVEKSLLSLRGSEKSKLQAFKNHTDELYQVFIQGITNIVKLAPEYLKNSLLQENNLPKDHEPMLGLLFAFLRLSQPFRDDLNRMTQRHLDFLYREVLKLGEKESMPDKAHLVFELAKPFQQYLLEKGIQFKAGKDKNNKEIIFALEDEIVVQKAQIENLKTLFLNQVKDQINQVSGIYMAPLANSADGNGAKFPDPISPSWATLGAKYTKLPSQEATATTSDFQPYPNAALGLVIASETLFLNEGTRTINLTITLGTKINEVNSQFENLKTEIQTKYFLNKEVIESSAKEGISALTIANLNSELGYRNNEKEISRSDIDAWAIDTAEKSIFLKLIKRVQPFSIQISSEKGWYIPYEVTQEFDNADPDVLTLKLGIILGEEEPAITYSDPKILAVDYHTTLPLLRFWYNHLSLPNGNRSLYDIFRNLIIQNIELKVNVSGVKNLIIQNDEGLLEINKPFLPFGSQPGPNANFYIGSKEIFQKKLESLRVHALWDKVSPELDKHYEMYQDFDIPMAGEEHNFANNLTFTAEILSNKKWTAYNVDGTPLLPYGQGTSIKEYCIKDFSNYNPSPLQELFAYNVYTTGGFLRFKTGDYTFLHENYSSSFAIQASAVAAKAVNSSHKVDIARYKKKGTDEVKVGKDITSGFDTDFYAELPKEPYTPIIKELWLDYVALASKNQLELIHLYSFEKTFLKKNLEAETTLLPYYKDEGSLHIGIKNLTPNSNLDVLFQVVESTADPDLEKANIQWHYLSNNEWKKLEKDLQILSDGTQGLTQSGIVKMAVPLDANAENTIMPSGLSWLKASASENSKAVCETLSVHTQAAKAVFKNNENDTDRLSKPLSAGSLAKFTDSKAQIKKVTQPYESFGGRSRENNKEFYIRVSERLRHKGRAINLHDYERLVLERFPDIYKVKCITHTLGRKMQEQDYELSPGFVTVAVIPDVSKLQYAQKLKPKAPLSILQKIEDFLKEKSSPFARIKVLNPRYEEIKVTGKVKFYPGKSDCYYLQQLKLDILEFLTPWAFGEQEKIIFGGKMYKSSILNFIETRSYVDYVTDFSMVDQQENILNEVTARTARSILASGQHSFETIPEKCCTQKVNVPQELREIGKFKIRN